MAAGFRCTLTHQTRCLTPWFIVAFCGDAVLAHSWILFAFAYKYFTVFDIPCLQGVADVVASYFVPVVVMLALAVFAMWMVLGVMVGCALAAKWGDVGFYTCIINTVTATCFGFDETIRT